MHEIHNILKALRIVFFMYGKNLTTWKATPLNDAAYGLDGPEKTYNIGSILRSTFVRNDPFRFPFLDLCN